MIRTTGIQTMTLTDLVTSPPVQSDSAVAMTAEVMISGMATTTNNSRVAQPRPNAARTGSRCAASKR